MLRLPCLITLALALVAAAAPAPALPPTPPPADGAQEAPPPPGSERWERSAQYGHEKLVFEIAGCRGFIILPGKQAARAPLPWIWYAPTFINSLPGERQTWIFSRLLEKGIAVAGVDVGESFGSLQGREVFTRFHQFVVAQFGLAPKACLWAQSRGGLMHFNWAADHPERVSCIGGTYPICHLGTYAGFETLAKAYGITVEELRGRGGEFNPLERLAPLAARRVPLLFMHGDQDAVVPLESNSAELARRYKALGGEIELMVVNGKGHQEAAEFFESPRLLEFFALHAAGGADWAAHPVNRWVRQSPREGKPAPDFPYEGSGSYDLHSRLWIHHGGHDGIPQGFHTFTFDLDTGDWEQRFPPTSPPGACCVDGSSAYDAAGRRFIHFPGGSLGHGYQWSRGVRLKGSPVWLYNPSTGDWTNMRPPPYRVPEKYSPDAPGGLCSGAAYDPVHELVLSFGGEGAGGAKNTLFAYETYSNQLHRLQAGNPPPPRDGMGIAFDAGHGKLVMFGSQYLPDSRTWIYDLRAGRWEAHDLDPHPLSGKVTEHYTTIPRMAYDPMHGIILCVAWLGEDRHETWAFQPGELRWSKLAPEIEPDGSKSRSRNLDFVWERNLFILETSSSRTNRPEIWTYRFAGAVRDPRPRPPEGLELATREGGKALLSWKAGDSQAVKEYRIYRARAGEPWKEDFSRVGSAAGAAFEDEGLEEGQVYTYVIRSVGDGGEESLPSLRARTQPRVLLKPIVSVLASNRVEVSWNRHPSSDVSGYNLYRGIAAVRTVQKGDPGPWKDNDPEYAEPLVAEVIDITDLKKLHTRPLVETTFSDDVDLARKEPGTDGYKHAVFAYVVRAVNRMGVESGPSPWGLTIPSEPLNVLCREDGEFADLRWSPAIEKNIAGYYIYKLEGVWNIHRITPEPIRETAFRHRSGKESTRYWVVAVDALGQEGQPSSPAWSGHAHRGFFKGEWHQ